MGPRPRRLQVVVYGEADEEVEHVANADYGREAEPKALLGGQVEDAADGLCHGPEHEGDEGKEGDLPFDLVFGW